MPSFCCFVCVSCARQYVAPAHRSHNFGTCTFVIFCPCAFVETVFIPPHFPYFRDRSLAPPCPPIILGWFALFFLYFSGRHRLLSSPTLHPFRILLAHALYTFRIRPFLYLHASDTQFFSLSLFINKSFTKSWPVHRCPLVLVLWFYAAVRKENRNRSRLSLAPAV